MSRLHQYLKGCRSDRVMLGLPLPTTYYCPRHTPVWLHVYCLCFSWLNPEPAENWTHLFSVARCNFLRQRGWIYRWTGGYLFCQSYCLGDLISLPLHFCMPLFLLQTSTAWDGRTMILLYSFSCSPVFLFLWLTSGGTSPIINEFSVYLQIYLGLISYESPLVRSIYFSAFCHHYQGLFPCSTL